MTRLALAAAFALLAVSAAAEPAPPRPATIAVTGSAEVELKPDFARLTAAIGTMADTVIQAAEANRAATDRVLARLQAMGVKREDIRTLNIQVLQTPPRVDRDGKEVKTPRFTATHRLQVTTRDLDGVGRLVGEILSAGDITFQSLAWGLDRQDEGQDEARRRAVRDARRQAEVYAGAAGVSLGRLVELRDGDARTLGAEAYDMPMRARAEAAPSVSVVPPAAVRSTATVAMVWELTP